MRGAEALLLMAIIGAVVLYFALRSSRTVARTGRQSESGWPEPALSKQHDMGGWLVELGADPECAGGVVLIGETSRWEQAAIQSQLPLAQVQKSVGDSSSTAYVVILADQGGNGVEIETVPTAGDPAQRIFVRAPPLPSTKRGDAIYDVTRLLFSKGWILERMVDKRNAEPGTPGYMEWCEASLMPLDNFMAVFPAYAVGREGPV